MNATLGLEGLFDCARIVRELHVSRTVAEKLMRRCGEKQYVPDARKVYVRAAELERVLNEHLRDT